MKTCVVTCTGSRPDLFRLCRCHVEAQTKKPDLWLVSNDCNEVMDDLPDYAVALQLEVPEYVEPTDTWPGKRASWHLLMALDHVPKGHHVVIMEDDDYYQPNHIETMVPPLERGDPIAGPFVTRRYHVPERRWGEGFTDSPIEGVIGIHASQVQGYAHGLRTEKFAINLWRKLGIKPTLPCTSVGIKGCGFGLPGRKGATAKHRKPHKLIHGDPEGNKLRQWIGAEMADAYFNLVHEVRT